MADAKKSGGKPEITTTGHSYDGIEELNTPLPRWWLWTFYATIAFGVLWTILYPAWPMIHGATPGLLGWSSRKDVVAEIKAHEAKNAPLVAELNAADLSTLTTDSPIYHYATERGSAVFKANCIQCHGAGAAGSKGYPNLKDDDWLWGGSQADILYTITHGIRNTTDENARYSQMPAFGDVLSQEEIANVVEYVYGFTHTDVNKAMAEKGKTLFADNCASCHGENGKGGREVGAPNLTDRIWLYGGDRATLMHTVTYARFGVMPAWGGRLSEADVRSVAVYVHSLGGGE